MAFLGFHTVSTLRDAYRVGWHLSKEESNRSAKFTDPSGIKSSVAAAIIFSNKNNVCENN
ncbi:hypothetical protein N9Z38_00640 [Mariniblastus sp.]|jgi:hypothetical protein|nr:hypothetical protein [Mariniblastus sp.]